MEGFHQNFSDAPEPGAIAAIGRTDFGVFQEIVELFPKHFSGSVIG
jgi:hypothetical protein